MLKDALNFKTSRPGVPLLSLHTPSAPPFSTLESNGTPGAGNPLPY